MPPHLEVAHIPYEQGGPYPGLFLFTQAARMARPVKQVCVCGGGGSRLEGNWVQDPSGEWWIHPSSHLHTLS